MIIILSDDENSNAENNNEEDSAPMNEAQVLQKQQFNNGELQSLTRYIPDDDTDDSDSEEELLLQRVKENLAKQQRVEQQLKNEKKRRAKCAYINEVEYRSDEDIAPLVKRRATFQCQSKEGGCDESIYRNAGQRQIQRCNNNNRSSRYNNNNINNNYNNKYSRSTTLTKSDVAQIRAQKVIEHEDESVITLAPYMSNNNNNFSHQFSGMDCQFPSYNTNNNNNSSYHYNNNIINNNNNTTDHYNYDKMRKAIDEIYNDMYYMEVDPYCPPTHVPQKRKSATSAIKKMIRIKTPIPSEENTVIK